MPNWTFNTITVRGSKEDLNKMMNDAEKTDGVLNLSSWFPVPETFKKYGVVGWYDYNCKMYGCKWNSELNVEHQSDEEVVFTADTPWSAPDAWLLRMSAKYPTLEFYNHAEYEEGYWEDSSYSEGCGDVCAEGEMNWDDEEEEEA